MSSDNSSNATALATKLANDHVAGVNTDANLESCPALTRPLLLQSMR